MKVDYMKPSQVKRVKIINRTVRTLKNGKQVPTFLNMVRQLNKDIANA